MLLLIPRAQAAAVSSLALNAAIIVSGFTTARRGYAAASNKQSWLLSRAAPCTDIGSMSSSASSKLSSYPRKPLGTLDCKKHRLLASNNFSGDGEISHKSIDDTSQTNCNDDTMMRTASTDDHPPNLPPLWENFKPGDYYVWLYTANDVPSSYERYQVTNVTIGEGVVIEIEMATHFPDIANTDDDGKDYENNTTNYCNTSRKYDVHHRMQLNLSDNLAAIDSRNDWRLNKFDYKWYDPEDPLARQQGLWEWRSAAAGPGDNVGENVQAFEEKFDCFAMVRQYEKKKKTNTKSSSGSGGKGSEDVQEEVASSATFEERKCSLNTKQINMCRTERHRYTGAWYGTESAGRLCGVALAKEFDPEFSFSLIEYGNEGGNVAKDVGVKVKLCDCGPEA